MHYQRRLINQFYFQLNECAKCPLIGKKRVQKDFTSREADILKIIFFMNRAAEESSIIFKDISTSERLPKSHRSKGAQKIIVEMYEIFKKLPLYTR